MSDDPAEKFNTCKFRAVAEDVYLEKLCCGYNTKIGFYCFKLDINGVLPILCQQCLAYEKKENLDE